MWKRSFLLKLTGSETSLHKFMKNNILTKSCTSIIICCFIFNTHNSVVVYGTLTLDIAISPPDKNKLIYIYKQRNNCQELILYF